ncbi:MAG TPA: ATP-binding protein [Candidatus Sulfotelmatobacter sp.]|jgi:PAS domain S-box-containing protein|nr:ATP-binding protein [Candidatus Sulfotelmatobacter sp.]
MTKSASDAPDMAQSPAATARRFLAVVLVLNLFVLGLVCLALWRSHEQYLQVSRVTVENLSRVLEEGLARFIDKVDLTLLDVIDEMERQKAEGGIDADRMNAFMLRHGERLPEALGLRVVNPQGQLLYADGQITSPKASVQGLDAFEHSKAVNDGKLYISKPLLGTLSGRPLIILARRLNNADGSFAGQAHVAVSLEQLAGMFDVVQLGAKGSVTLSNGDGRVVARNPNLGDSLSLIEKPIILPLLHSLLTEGKTSASYHTRSVVDGVERVYFFRKVKGRDLYLQVGIADDDSLAGWRRQVAVMGALALLFVTMTVGGGTVGYRGWRERYRVAEQLAAKEAAMSLFREALEKSNDSILIVDLEDSRILDFNLTACEQLGRLPEEMGSLFLCDIDPELSDREGWRKLIQATPGMEDGESVMLERLHRRPDGKVFPVEVSWRRVVVNGRRVGISIERDISERKKFESRIADLSQLNQRVISESMLGLITYRQDGQCVLANEAAARFLGCGVADLLKQNFRTLPSWNETLRQLAADVLETGKSRQLSRYFTSTFGRSFWVDGVMSRFMVTGEPHLLLAFDDVSEQKTAELALQAKTDELERINAALIQSNADLERFAYVASHDLQTPLRTIVSYTQLLERRTKGQLDQDCQDFIGFIVEGAKRMSRLITDLLEYARVTSQGKPLGTVSSERAAEFALANLQVAVEDCGAQVRFQALPMVMADESQLVSLFQNLIGNAIKYRHPERAPLIELTAEPGEAGMWRFSVRDNGIGIERDYYHKVFEIFQRLNPSGQVEGTGVGLAVCQRIVRRFGGDIWLESDFGKGSVFYFTLHQAGDTVTAIPVS